MPFSSRTVPRETNAESLVFLNCKMHNYVHQGFCFHYNWIYFNTKLIMRGNYTCLSHSITVLIIYRSCGSQESIGGLFREACYSDADTHTPAAHDRPAAACRRPARPASVNAHVPQVRVPCEHPYQHPLRPGSRSP